MQLNIWLISVLTKTWSGIYESNIHW